jgi:transcriptional regulator with XRE-family HTH domain
MVVTVNQAVRALRKHVRKTQQIFATELGISISSLNNYERQRTPEPKQLIAFQRAAQEAGRDDLAHVFWTEAQEALGIEWRWYSGSGARLSGLDRNNPENWYEVAALEALENCLGGATLYQDIAPSVVSAIALAVARQSEVTEDRDLVKRFAEESSKRGFVPKVRGRVQWETKIQKGKAKRL